MRTACENCRTVYDGVGDDPALWVCPYCEHVNRPPEGAAALQPDPEIEIMAEHDPLKTMVLPMDSQPGDTGAAVDPVAAKAALGARMGLTVVVEKKPPELHVIAGLRVIIGRGLCDIRVSDPGISREHCSIEVQDAVPVLKDLQSANGTRLNDQFITEHVLADGDEIRIGSTLLRFHLALPE